MAVKHGRGASVSQEILLSYKLPSMGEDDAGFDGLIKWKRNDQSAMLIRYFRGVVLKKDSDAISSIIDAIKGDMHVSVMPSFL
ncbi:unnamed protein product [Toxocara canis]|uniref:Bet_v_1 domain-containing protein n=1 Tax=Toxocara canis TaxID=6265 RepID=A0A183VG81_TOXCA|nr:unnamed protein product [Toxocara canis]